MQKTDCWARFYRDMERFTEFEWSLSSGRLMPKDFVMRLVRLKEASGLTWSGMARAIGVDYKQMYRWREKGVVPSGGSVIALYCFASRVRGGLDIMLGTDQGES